MAEVLVRFTESVHADGVSYSARVCGAPTDEGRWEGWIEFIAPGAEDAVIRTGRETLQRNHADLLYWAEGLSATYLDGALHRALHSIEREVGPKIVKDTPAYSGSAEPPQRTGPMSRRPVLDPFVTYAQGEEILRSQLGALTRDQLEIIRDAYALYSESGRVASARTNADMIDEIVAGVRAKVP